MENTQQPAQTSGAQPPPITSPVNRPRSVSLLAVGVLIFTVINLTRFVLSLRHWNFLATQPGVSPLYLALSGFIWTLAGIYLLWGLWRAKTWAPRLMQAEALTYALYYWLDLLFLKDHPLSESVNDLSVVLPINWKFSAVITVVCLGFVLWALGRSRVKTYFRLDKTQTGHERVEDDLGQDEGASR